MKHKRIMLFILPILVAGTICLVLDYLNVFTLIGIKIGNFNEMSVNVIVSIFSSIVAGSLTLFGVKLTLKHQEESENEKQRFENMPILKFTSVEDDWYDFRYALKTDCISVSNDNSDEIDTILAVSLANSNPAFSVYLNSYSDGNKECKMTYINAMNQSRLVSQEKIQIAFNLDSNVKSRSVFRFGYSDLFGNEYYQDVPFLYNEQGNVFKFFDLKKPTLINNSRPLTDVAQEEISRFK